MIRRGPVGPGQPPLGGGGKLPPPNRVALAALGIFAALAAGCGETPPDPRLEVVEWTLPISQAGTEAADPSMGVDPLTGELLLAWVGGGEAGWNLYASRWTEERGFTEPARVNDIPGDVHPHAEGAPRLVAAPGVVALFWNNTLVVEGRRFAASDLRFSRSLDGGESWSPAVNLQDPLQLPTLPARAHTFHGATWAGDSTLVVAWLDGRDRDDRRIQRGVAEGLSREEAARTPEAFADDHDLHDGDATVFAAVSHDLGATWESENRRIAENSCPCCRVALLRTRPGEVVGAWRGNYPGSVRDPALQVVLPTAHQDGPPLRIHEDGWVFPGCPHSGPGLDMDSSGTLHAAWYTGGEGRMGVHYARSLLQIQGSASAEEVLRRGFDSPLPIAVGEAVGVAHPAVVGLSDGGALVAHNVSNDGRRVIVFSAVSSDGRVVGRHEVADSEGGTHPQLARLPDGSVAAAWTESRGGIQRVRMVRIQLDPSPRPVALEKSDGDVRPGRGT